MLIEVCYRAGRGYIEGNEADMIPVFMELPVSRGERGDTQIHIRGGNVMKVIRRFYDRKFTHVVNTFWEPTLPNPVE